MSPVKLHDLINEYKSNVFRVYPRTENSSNTYKLFEIILYIAISSKKQDVLSCWKPGQKITHGFTK